jgi:hypothetical protein
VVRSRPGRPANHFPSDLIGGHSRTLAQGDTHALATTFSRTLLVGRSWPPRTSSDQSVIIGFMADTALVALITGAAAVGSSALTALVTASSTRKQADTTVKVAESQARVTQTTLEGQYQVEVERLQAEADRGYYQVAEKERRLRRDIYRDLLSATDRIDDLVSELKPLTKDAYLEWKREADRLGNEVMLLGSEEVCEALSAWDKHLRSLVGAMEAWDGKDPVSFKQPLSLAWEKNKARRNKVWREVLSAMRADVAPPAVLLREPPPAHAEGATPSEDHVDEARPPIVEPITSRSPGLPATESAVPTEPGSPADPGG